MSSSGGQSLSSTNDGRTAFDASTGWMVNDGSNNRVLIGKRKDGSYGIDVSKAGQEVGGATGSQLVMSSRFNSFKIVGTGTAVINTGFLLIPHGLGFTPAYLAYVGGGASNFNLPYIDNAINATTNRVEILNLLYAGCDATNISFYQSPGNGTNQVYGLRYYLLQETAN